jgi:putative restriction endonuclease
VLGDPRLALVVSPALRAYFSNGEQFYAQAGEVIDLPARRGDRPGADFRCTGAAICR